MATFNSDAVKPEFNQYWYSKLTIDSLLSEATHHATRCAFLSTPSLYFALGENEDKDNSNDDDDDSRKRAVALRADSKLFEFDRQWSSDPGFVFYDYTKPEQIPIQYMNHFDYVVVDPPFITQEVWACYVETIKLIIKRDPNAGTEGAVGSGNIRDCLGGGKVLFTTILENHAMLEGLINGPLFIPRFRPSVCNLVYQYVCYTNYEATRLQRSNPEVTEDGDHDESRKLWAAIGMANDMRHSETAFAIQMETRDRRGEQLLDPNADKKVGPALRGPLLSECEGGEPVVFGMTADGQCIAIRGGGGGGGGVSDGGGNVASVVQALAWGHVPEGLTLYPGGNDAAAAAAAGEEEEVYGLAYAAVAALRRSLDDFKAGIDQRQRAMDVQLKLRHQRVRLSKERQQLMLSENNSSNTDGEREALTAKADAAIAAVTADIASSEADRTLQLDAMAALADSIVMQERSLAKLVNSGSEDEVDVPYAAGMAECVAAYRTVGVKKQPLQELASDATRKYKSPLFARMTRLMQDMKDMKKEHQRVLASSE